MKGEAREARGGERERRGDGFGYPTTCNEFLGSRGRVGSGKWEVRAL
jgi:hypothetical protein